MAKASPKERVLLYLKSRLWIEGRVHIPSNQGVLDYANDRDCHFIPLTDVTVFGDADADTVTIDFLAVNVEEIGLMTTYRGKSDPFFRQRIMEMVLRQPGAPPDEKLESAVGDLVGWLGEDVVGRLNTCLALLGNGRSDDRITGVKLVVNQLVSDLQERTSPFGNNQEGPHTEEEAPEPDSVETREEPEQEEIPPPGL